MNDVLRRIEQLLADLGDPRNLHLPADMQIEILLRERKMREFIVGNLDPQEVALLKRRIAAFESMTGLKIEQWLNVDKIRRRLNSLATEAGELAAASAAAAAKMAEGAKACA